MGTKYTDKLAILLLVTGVAAVVYLICHYFGNIILYILAAGVISLLAKPVVHLLAKVNIKGRHIPSWLSAILSILLIFLILGCIIAGLIPVVSEVIAKISSVNTDTYIHGLSEPLSRLNVTLRDRFNLGYDFRLEDLVRDKIVSVLDINLFGSVVGSVASILVSVGIATFSIVFISFFFIKDEGLFGRIVSSFIPDRSVNKASEAMKEVSTLLSRYFVGLVIEMAGVGLIDFIGLWAFVGIGFEAAIGIGFLAGIFNIIPYLGPLIGGVLGVSMSIILAFFGGGAACTSLSFTAYLLLLVVIFCVAQLVDNYVYQPVIYSTSIKAHPLEIFIVLLIAGTVGGVFGMLVAIPTYTVVRVIAGKFFPDVKFIKLLTKSSD